MLLDRLTLELFVLLSLATRYENTRMHRLPLQTQSSMSRSW
jgi:hypothetical protein